MTTEVSQKKIRQFQEKIFSWWKENKRDFPWRETTDPYKIMISEVMLQQTQASRVEEKYLEFVEKYTTLKSLASAPKAELLSIWSGLGYNRRVLWLQEAAKQLLELEKFPETPSELQKLKGIGKYTSRSILIFAFNQDISTVDTNIRRILIAEGFAKENTSEKELFKIAEKLIPSGKSRDWHNALMDYGAIHLTSSKTGIKPTTQQSNFKGSNREKRGKILKYILENKITTINTLSKNLETPKKELEPILERMIKEGLISKNGNKYQVE